MILEETWPAVVASASSGAAFLAAIAAGLSLPDIGDEGKHRRVEGAAGRLAMIGAGLLAVAVLLWFLYLVLGPGRGVGAAD